jgi:hypothetical protein
MAFSAIAKQLAIVNDAPPCLLPLLLVETDNVLASCSCSLMFVSPPHSLLLHDRLFLVGCCVLMSLVAAQGHDVIIFMSLFFLHLKQ